MYPQFLLNFNSLALIVGCILIKYLYTSQLIRLKARFWLRSIFGFSSSGWMFTKTIQYITDTFFKTSWNDFFKTSCNWFEPTSVQVFRMSRGLESMGQQRNKIRVWIGFTSWTDILVRFVPHATSEMDLRYKVIWNGSLKEKSTQRKLVEAYPAREWVKRIIVIPSLRLVNLFV